MPSRQPAQLRTGRAHTTALVLAACLSAAMMQSAAGGGSGEGAPPMGSAPSLSRIRGGLQVTAPSPLAPHPSRDVADLRGARRTIAIFTTAALPWLTGTSINPLLRAWALACTPERHRVTLCVPFLAPEDQEKVFPADAPSFATPSEQEAFLREWTRDHISSEKSDPVFEIAFYRARWVDEIGAIIPLGDLIQECLPDATPDVTPDKTTDKTGRSRDSRRSRGGKCSLDGPRSRDGGRSRDVAILEEPEHLNWYKGHPWKERFSFVVGIVHTNYLVYRLTDDCIPEPVRELWAEGFELLGRKVSATACHKIIKLSDAVGEREQSVTANVNGVRPHFLALGKERRKQGLGFEGGAYYIGKALWTKGYRELLDACTGYKEATGRHVKLTLFGDGPDLEAIKLEAEEKGLHWTFEGAIDHGDLRLQPFRVLFNPSTSDVVCTTSAEALAMNKMVLCPEHPSNAFFARFKNTICYPLGNVPALNAALSHTLHENPVALSPQEQEELTWDAATQRLYSALLPPPPPAPIPTPSGGDSALKGRTHLAPLVPKVARQVAFRGGNDRRRFAKTFGSRGNQAGE